MGPERRPGFIEGGLDFVTKASVVAAVLSVFFLRFDYTAKFGVLAFLGWFGKKQFEKKPG